MSAKHGLPEDPTPAQIRRMCERIRKHWNDYTRERREHTGRVRWRVPEVKSYPDGELSE